MLYVRTNLRRERDAYGIHECSFGQVFAADDNDDDGLDVTRHRDVGGHNICGRVGAAARVARRRESGGDVERALMMAEVNDCDLYRL